MYNEVCAVFRVARTKRTLFSQHARCSSTRALFYFPTTPQHDYQHKACPPGARSTVGSPVKKKLQNAKNNLSTTNQKFRFYSTLKRSPYTDTPRLASSPEFLRVIRPGRCENEPQPMCGAHFSPCDTCTCTCHVHVHVHVVLMHAKQER